MGVDHLPKPFHPQQARLRLLQVEHRDLAPGGAEHLDHRPACLAAASLIVGRHLRGNRDARLVAGNVDGEDRDPGGVGLADHRHDRLRVAGREHDGRRLLDEKILDLVSLADHVLIGAHEDRVVALLFPLGRDRVADHLEEGIVEREQRHADRAPRLAGGRGGAGPCVGSHHEGVPHRHGHFVSRVGDEPDPAAG